MFFLGCRKRGGATGLGRVNCTGGMASAGVERSAGADIGSMLRGGQGEVKAKAQWRDSE
jgi:hypothetical protein